MCLHCCAKRTCRTQEALSQEASEKLQVCCSMMELVKYMYGVKGCLACTLYSDTTAATQSMSHQPNLLTFDQFSLGTAKHHSQTSYSWHLTHCSTQVHSSYASAVTIQADSNIKMLRCSQHFSAETLRQLFVSCSICKEVCGEQPRGNHACVACLTQRPSVQSTLRCTLYNMQFRQEHLQL